MSGLDSREKAFEDFFIRKVENEGKLKAKAYRMFGAWAAEQLSLEGDDADSYVKDLILYELDSANTGTALTKVMADFSEQGLSLDKFDVQDKFREFYDAATRDTA